MEPTHEKDEPSHRRESAQSRRAISARGKLPLAPEPARFRGPRLRGGQRAHGLFEPGAVPRGKRRSRAILPENRREPLVARSSLVPEASRLRAGDDQPYPMRAALMT